MFHDSWQHNKGVCQPKMSEITNEWKRFSMTTVPQNWQNGFPEQEEFLMIKEVISNTFTINVNKQSEIPPTTQTKEVVSNTFNLIINKGEVIPPEQI